MEVKKGIEINSFAVLFFINKNPKTYKFKKLSLKMYPYLNQDRSLIFQVNGKDNCNYETIIDCFYDKLEKFKNDIEGIRMISYSERKFLVTFLKIEKCLMTSVRDPVHALCQDGLERKDNIKITTTIPQQPAELITLFPVPFEMGEQQLRSLERRGWGAIKKIQFGSLRNYPKIKNGYVNLYIQDPDYFKISGQVNIMGHWMSVTTPHNRHLPMCRFCKVRGHEINDCSKLWKKKQQNKKEEERVLRNQIKTSSSEEDIENNQEKREKMSLEDFTIVRKKRSRISPKNKKKRRKQKFKKIRKDKNFTEPETSESEISQTEDMKSDEEDVLNNAHPQLSDSTEEEDEPTDKSEPETTEVKTQKIDQNEKENDMDQKTFSSNSSQPGETYRDITIKNIPTTNYEA